MKKSIVSMAVLAVGITLCGFFISQTIHKGQTAINTVQVKGLAEKRVDADTAYWVIETGFFTEGDNANQSAMYAGYERNVETILVTLKANGFTDAEVSVGVAALTRKDFRDEDNKVVDVRHYINGEISIETNQISLVKKARIALNKLIPKGIPVTNNEPEYHFTKLNEIKPAMLREATKNARIAADEFASNVGSEVGGIKTARQGTFSITDVGSNYGNKKKLSKEVRVVTDILFYIK